MRPYWDILAPGIAMGSMGVITDARYAEMISSFNATGKAEMARSLSEKPSSGTSMPATSAPPGSVFSQTEGQRLYESRKPVPSPSTPVARERRGLALGLLGFGVLFAVTR